MNFTSFLIFIIIVYVIYYVGNIAYDIYLSSKKQNVKEDENTFDDIGIHIEEEYKPTDAGAIYASTYAPEDGETNFGGNDESQGLNYTKLTADPNPTTQKYYEFSNVFDKKDIANVTIHGGETVEGIANMFSELSKSGNNPFSSLEGIYQKFQ
ncbi:hypothetical protein FACS189451_03690 [Bacteroidia bacterium]|nr:hypothetical protein FACS189446_8150 [Bacteroidia bacterium]GHT61521.1 hypothetical protein FACS189451_03690 [Bacteroidia bacterium]